LPGGLGVVVPAVLVVLATVVVLFTGGARHQVAPTALDAMARRLDSVSTRADSLEQALARLAAAPAGPLTTIASAGRTVPPPPPAPSPAVTTARPTSAASTRSTRASRATVLPPAPKLESTVPVVKTDSTR
jgi:hypothetical protein